MLMPYFFNILKKIFFYIFLAVNNFILIYKKNLMANKNHLLNYLIFFDNLYIYGLKNYNYIYLNLIVFYLEMFFQIKNVFIKKL